MRRRTVRIELLTCGVLVVANLLGGCSNVSFVRTTNLVLPPRPRDAVFEFVLTKQPRCPYDEIGIIRAEDGDLQRAYDLVRAKALSVGADAVIITDRGTVVYNRSHTSTKTSPSLMDSSKTETKTRTHHSSHSANVINAVAIHYRCEPPTPGRVPASAPTTRPATPGGLQAR